jgi:hypothetical protein
VLLSIVGLSALGGFATKSKEQIQQIREEENKMYEMKTASGDVTKNDHKRWHDPAAHAKSLEPSAPEPPKAADKAKDK